MRLLQVVHQYPPEKLGGTELYTQSLAGELVRRGHMVTVFTRSLSRQAPAAEGAGGETVLWGRGGTTAPGRRFLAGFSDRPCWTSFWRVLSRERPDVVHVQHLMGLPMGLLDTLHRRRLPIVLSLHDYWWLCPNAQLLRNDDGSPCSGPSPLACARCAGARQGGAARPAAPLLAPLMAWRSGRLRHAVEWVTAVAPSRYVLDTYARLGFTFARALVVPHGIAARPSTPPLPADGGPLRLLYVGGISPQKGVHVLLQALRLVPSEAVTLEVVGGAAAGCEAYLAELNRAATGLPVRFRGQLSPAGVAEAFAAAHALAMPSIWPETFGLVTAEAFAAGRPVLASRIGALPERVADGVDGLLVAPGDATAWAAAIRALADDRALLARLTSGVRPPLTLTEHVDAIEGIYRDALAG